MFGEEPLWTGHAGYYYAMKLPLGPELDLALLLLQDAGIVEQVRPL